MSRRASLSVRFELRFGCWFDAVVGLESQLANLFGNRDSSGYNRSDEQCDATDPSVGSVFEVKFFPAGPLIAGRSSSRETDSVRPNFSALSLGVAG